MEQITCTNYSDQGTDVEFYIEVNVSGDIFLVSSVDIVSDVEIFGNNLIEFLDDAVSGQEVLSLGDNSITLHVKNGSKEYPFSELQDDCCAEVFVETLFSQLGGGL